MCKEKLNGGYDGGTGVRVWSHALVVMATSSKQQPDIYAVVLGITGRHKPCET